MAQFSYNLQKSSATNKSPFELAIGQQPSTPHSVVVGYAGICPAAYRFAKEWHQNAEIAKAYLEKAARRAKKHADKDRRPETFKVGDLVLVKLNPKQFTSTFRKVHKGLVRKYDGPFPIIEKIGNVSYKALRT